MRISDSDQKTSPTRLLEMLSDRFGAFEAIANSSIKLARVAPEEELAMEVQVAEAVLEFGEDLRGANRVASAWAEGREGPRPHRTARSEG
jgi:hypothetical protein